MDNSISDLQPISVLALDIDGVLTDGRVLYSQDGMEQKFISFRDIDAVFEAHRCNLQVALVTGEDTPWLESFSHRMQIEYTILGAKYKLEAIKNLAQQLQVPLSAICYVGDSDRDVPAIAAVGLGLAPANATTRAKAAAHMVLKSLGGDGAVREALDYILERKTAAQEKLGKVGRGSPVHNKQDLQLSIQRIKSVVTESLAVQQAVANQLAPLIAQAAGEIIAAIKSGHKLLIFGNGGSAADAQHMAAELVGRFEVERMPMAAIALTTDTSILTALANDYGPATMFARQIEAVGESGDVALAISTSGNSSNVLEGIYTAQQVGIRIIGMTGNKGGKLAQLVDLCLCVPSDNTARIQEAHGLIIHLLCSLIEGDAA